MMPNKTCVRAVRVSCVLIIHGWKVRFIQRAFSCKQLTSVVTRGLAIPSISTKRQIDSVISEMIAAFSTVLLTTVIDEYRKEDILLWFHLGFFFLEIKKMFI